MGAKRTKKTGRTTLSVSWVDMEGQNARQRTGARMMSRRFRRGTERNLLLRRKSLEKEGRGRMKAIHIPRN